ncbi:hypothetical protein K1X76_01900 [bacterium]|nr:hypothetical protein [bacterium]
MPSVTLSPAELQYVYHYVTSHTDDVPEGWTPDSVDPVLVEMARHQWALLSEGVEPAARIRQHLLVNMPEGEERTFEVRAFEEGTDRSYVYGKYSFLTEVIESYAQSVDSFLQAHGAEAAALDPLALLRLHQASVDLHNLAEENQYAYQSDAVGFYRIARTSSVLTGLLTLLGSKQTSYHVSLFLQGLERGRIYLTGLRSPSSGLYYNHPMLATGSAYRGSMDTEALYYFFNHFTPQIAGCRVVKVQVKEGRLLVVYDGTLEYAKNVQETILFLTEQGFIESAQNTWVKNIKDDDTDPSRPGGGRVARPEVIAEEGVDDRASEIAAGPQADGPTDLARPQSLDDLYRELGVKPQTYDTDYDRYQALMRAVAVRGDNFYQLVSTVSASVRFAARPTSFGETEASLVLGSLDALLRDNDDPLKNLSQVNPVVLERVTQRVVAFRQTLRELEEAREAALRATEEAAREVERDRVEERLRVAP